MPKVTIWIRDKDLLAWNAIKDRPEWLHEQLSRNAPVKQSNVLIKEIPSHDEIRKRDAILAGVKPV